MKDIITWAALILFGFIMGAGVGFKVLEGVSGDLVAEAWDNSYAQFQKSYSGSAAQKSTDALIEKKKQELMMKVRDELTEYIVKSLKGEPVTTPVTK